MTRPRNPYDLGPFQAKREIPRMLAGSAILAGGLYGMVRLLTNKTRAAVQPQLAPPLTASAGRGSRWDR